MAMKQIFVLSSLLLSGFLLSGCTLLVGAYFLNKKQPTVTVQEEVFRQCSHYIAVLTPYTSALPPGNIISWLSREITKPYYPSEEERVNYPGSSKTLKPFSEEEFKELVRRYARSFEADTIRDDESYSNNNVRIVVVELQSLKKWEKTRFAQVHRAGKPCGVWETYPK
jgi:hypothetical protein